MVGWVVFTRPDEDLWPLRDAIGLGCSPLETGPAERGPCGRGAGLGEAAGSHCTGPAEGCPYRVGYVGEAAGLCITGLAEGSPCGSSSIRGTWAGASWRKPMRWTKLVSSTLLKLV